MVEWKRLARIRPSVDGFTLVELLVAVAVVALLAAIAVPVYRDYTATSRDSVLLNQINAMAVFQEDTRLRTGRYGAGEYDGARGVNTLRTSIGWAPAADDGRTYRRDGRRRNKLDGDSDRPERAQSLPRVPCR